MNKKTVGIFGGTFDPPHYGHTQVVETILILGLVDKIWVMPCYTHKFNKSISDWEHRLNMCTLSFVNNNNIKNVSTSSMELLNKEGDTYNLNKILNKIKNYEFSYIIGMDNALDIQKWVNWQKLIKECKFIVYPRPRYGSTEKKWFNFIPHTVINHQKVNISSTEIRKMYKEGNYKVIDYVSKDVHDYIIRNGLYKIRK